MLGEFQTGSQAAVRTAVTAVKSPAVALKPVPSPAHDLTRQVVCAFRGNATPAGDDWEEF